jgi:hypothetical protein
MNNLTIREKRTGGGESTQTISFSPSSSSAGTTSTNNTPEKKERVTLPYHTREPLTNSTNISSTTFTLPLRPQQPGQFINAPRTPLQNLQSTLASLPPALHVRCQSAIDYYFMKRVENIPTEDMLQIHEMWQKMCEDVEDLANTIGMGAAEMLVEELLGPEWKNETGYQSQA